MMDAGNGLSPLVPAKAGAQTSKKERTLLIE
jgi:hypothetical protein